MQNSGIYLAEVKDIWVNKSTIASSMIFKRIFELANMVNIKRKINSNALATTVWKFGDKNSEI
jgi:hypothetical protein